MVMACPDIAIMFLTLGGLFYLKAIVH